MKIIAQRIESLENEIYSILEYEVERLARKALKRRSGNLKEFVMGMGTAFFVTHEGEVFNFEEEIYTPMGYKQEPKKGFKEIYNFFLEYDDKYQITGIPMRFTVDGPKLTDW